jgi:DNA polymerase III epsilon subunit-like protein
VFHNGFGFDLPFLVRRSWLLDVPVPGFAFSQFKGGLNRDLFADTMTAWSLGKYNDFTSLDTLARAFGIEGKLKGCSGADFDRMWHGSEEERATALEYLKQDVRVTMQLAQFMGIT